LLKKVLWRKKNCTFARRWRNGRAVDCGGLENRCPPYGGPGVRIPFPPPSTDQQDEIPRKMLILWGFMFLSQAMKSSKKHHFCGLNGGLF
jgi:hypothetical protein